MDNQFGIHALSTRVLVPKYIFQVLNSLFEIENKLSIHGDPGNVRRSIDRIKEALETEGLFYENPMGQDFAETRTDVEASITGVGTDDLQIVEVIKPIIRLGERSSSRIIQKGIVVVKSKSRGDA